MVLSTGLGSVEMISSSGLSSTPAAISRSRRSAFAAAVTGASSASIAMRLVSRAAVFARMPARPSSRFCSLERSASVSVASFLTRARSSRSSSAATWNLARLAGFSGPFCTAVSTSRAARASTGITPASSPPRARREPPERRPVTDEPLEPRSLPARSLPVWRFWRWPCSAIVLLVPQLASLARVKKCRRPIHRATAPASCVPDPVAMRLVGRRGVAPILGDSRPTLSI
jgi:hypothetical protein